MILGTLTLSVILSNPMKQVKACVEFGGIRIPYCMPQLSAERVLGSPQRMVPHRFAGAAAMALTGALLALPAHAQDRAPKNVVVSLAQQQENASAGKAQASDIASFGTASSGVASSGEGDDAMRAGSIAVPQLPDGVGLPQVDTIISDEEFNRVIPALDPDGDAVLNQPLESIDSFERRIAAEHAAAKIDPEAKSEQPQVAHIPAAQPTDDMQSGAGIKQASPVEIVAIGDAPVADAELSAPLVPLNQFDVSAVQFAEDDDTSRAATQVAYSISLNGLDSADKETSISLITQFKTLSALYKGGRTAANAAMLSARLTEDSELIKTILASEGWYDPRVRTRLNRSTASGSLVLEAVIDVQPGKRFKLASITVKADPTLPPTLIADNLALKVGEPIVADRVQGAEAKVALVLPENGYPFAAIGDRDILLDQETGEGDYTLPVIVGPRARFGGFTTEGDLAFDAKHVELLARFKRGELYDSRKVDDLRKALVATGLFSTVSAEPAKTGQVAEDGTEFVDMLVKQDAGPPRTIAGSAGYAAGQGFTLEGTWTNRNKFRPEGALIVHGIAGTQQQGAGVTFRRANAGQRDRTFEVVTEALHTNYDAYDAITGRVAARISYDSTQIWQKKLTYAFGGEILGTAEKDYDFSNGERRRRTYYIGALNGQVGLDTSDDLLNPTKGFRLTALIQPEGSLQGNFTPYVRARIDGSMYHSFGESFVLAGRLRLGTIQGASREDIAPSRRLYSGGGGSVRGFGYQKLGKLDPNGDPTGGRSLNEGAIEGRYRFGDYGVVAFLDAGQSYETVTPRFSDLRYGVGIGGRFYTNFGPLRVDVATPLGRRPGEARLNIYVSIGQAF